MTPLPISIPSTVHFQSSTLRIDLIPDSRGYVLFRLSKRDQDDTNSFSPLTSLDVLTCEYLVDLMDVNVQAVNWIVANCEEIKHEDRHLYFKFKGG